MYILIVDLEYRESLNVSRKFGIPLFPVSGFVGNSLKLCFLACYAAEFEKRIFSKTE